MTIRAHWIILSFSALVVSAALVVVTAPFENNALALFPTHDYDGDMLRRVGYGWPFAFREIVSTIDTSTTHFHWGPFLLSVCLVALFGSMLLRWMNRAS